MWLDYDHDGDLDLLVLNFARADGRGESRLLRNDGERFVNVTAHSGLRLRAPGHDVAGLLSDLAGDGRLDLIVFDVGGRHNPVVYTLAGHRFFDNSHNFDFGATPMIRSGPRILDSVLSEISTVFQAACATISKYTASGVRRSSAACRRRAL